MRRILTLAVAAVLTLAAPASALAATAAPAATSAPAAAGDAAVKGAPAIPSDIDVQLWPEDVKGSTTLVVVAVVPTSAPLPASVTIPVPEGAAITWAGEIFDTGQSDVPRQPVMSNDKRTVTITTQKSRVIQYEAQYKPYAVRNGRLYAEVDWAQSAPADRVEFAFRLPPLATDVKSTPRSEGGPAVNQSGQKLYTLPTQKLAVGSSFKLAVDYVPQAAGLGQSVKKGPDVVMISLVSVLGLVLAALAVVLVRSRRSV